MPAGLLAKLVRRSRRSKGHCSLVYNGKRSDPLVDWIIEQELDKQQIPRQPSAMEMAP
jgi:hypothetical protein